MSYPAFHTATRRLPSFKSTSVPVLLAAALFAVGCGGKGEAADTKAPVTAGAAPVASSVPSAEEARIRKNLHERLPDLPAVDEVTAIAIPGLYEVRVGTEIVYTDAEVNYVFQGNLIDAKKRVNLTEARITKLTEIQFDKLPLKDAVVWKSGTGERKLAVFADPNCGYCKRLEGDLQKLKNTTVYTFLVPVLGPDSSEKAKNIWCAKDQTQTWISWMLNAKLPPKSTANCDTPLERNLALATKHRINGTPALIFTDNTRVPGAIGLDDIEKRLTAATKASKG